MLDDVDFWSKKYDYKKMKERHRNNLYPPKIKAHFIPQSENRHAHCSFQVSVDGCTNSKGCDEHSLNSSIHLPLGITALDIDL